MNGLVELRVKGMAETSHARSSPSSLHPWRCPEPFLQPAVRIRIHLPFRIKNVKYPALRVPESHLQGAACGSGKVHITCGVWSCTMRCSQGLQMPCAHLSSFSGRGYLSQASTWGCHSSASCLFFLAVAAVIGNFGLFVSLLVLWKAFRGCLRGKGLGTV